MNTILITGGAGFIGANFVSMATANGQRVVNLDKLTYAGSTHSLTSLRENERHVFVQGDIGSPEVVEGLLARYTPSAIVNFAAETHVDRSIDGPAAFIQTNVVATLSLLESTRNYWQKLTGDAHEAFRFLHVSTDEVFGSLGPDGAFSERSPYAPNSPYSASKAASDHLVRAFHHTYGLPTLVTNCSNNYGPYQFPEKLIPLTIEKALSGQKLPIYGDGKNIRDWLYVEDHCRAIELVLKHGRVGETYNIGGNAERENIHVVETICALLDQLSPNTHHVPRSSLITFVADRPGHDRRYAIDSSKLQNELGWRPALTFEQGLALTVRWYLENRDWTRQVLNDNYELERLGV